MIIEEIVKRRSIRVYKPDPIEPGKLERVLEAGRLAPTARNSQQWKIIVVEDEDVRARLIDEAAPHQPSFKEAPVILVACGLDPGHVMKCGHPSYIIDLSIVLAHISLQAVREDLGTCWIGSFFEDKAKKVLNIPEEVRLVELMTLGAPGYSPPPTPRNPA
ncbi:MAG: nitroreductase, partial [bacterium]|nr:nitroreductase [bacterium]